MGAKDQQCGRRPLHPCAPCQRGLRCDEGSRCRRHTAAVVHQKQEQITSFDNSRAPLRLFEQVGTAQISQGDGLPLMAFEEVGLLVLHHPADGCAQAALLATERARKIGDCHLPVCEESRDLAARSASAPSGRWHYNYNRILMGSLHHLTVYGPGQRAPLFQSRGRFGDWFEPVGIALEPRSPLARAAYRRGISGSLAFTLLVERDMCRAATVPTQLDWDALRRKIADLPLRATTTGPGQLNGSYLRLLERTVNPLVPPA